MRRLPGHAAAVVAVLLLGLLPARADASPSSDVDAAQRKANAAAARLAKAEADLARVVDDVAELEAKAAAAERRLLALTNGVKAAAVGQYMDGGMPRVFLTGRDLMESVRANELARFATTNAVDTIDRFRAARDDVRQAQKALAGRLAQRRSAAASLRKQTAAARAEVARLAAIQQALAAKARRGAAPVSARLAGVIVSGAWVCPVQGPHAFSDDYGDPRAGPPAHRHQGVDILAPRGTPVVANVSGTVSRTSNSLGGLSYFLHGSDGNTYYGAHLSGYAAAGSVAAGTVIGYVGNSGDARGGATHLHFEIHPGGGASVNPYPTLVRYC